LIITKTEEQDPSRQTKKYSDDLLGRVAAASLHLEDLDLFDGALSVITKLPQWVYPMIGKAIQNFGLSELQER
jgi:hypothetical protein